jgi:predicted PurR-regulated permease PerM
MNDKISIDTVIGISGFLFSFMIYYFDIKKKLEQLIREKEGTLTRQQAQDLTKVYLLLVQSSLNTALDRYAHNGLPKHYLEGNVDKIMQELHEIYEGVVENKIRPMVSTFRLRDGQRFSEFAASVSDRNISKGFKDTRDIFQNNKEHNKTINELLPILARKISEIGDSGEALYTEQLKVIYRKDDK